MLKDRQILMIYIFLTITTLAVFWWVANCEFIIFDDPLYVTQNTHVKDGLTMSGIRWAFTTGHAANWHPLTWISLMLDAQFYGLQPRGYHITNLLFHLANTLLLFFVLQRMTQARWQSAFVAALFALHPLHVESVAFVAERKDVLSTLFWVLTMGAYCAYVEQPRLQRYLLVVVFFAFGLMSKPMLVTLPFVLLLLDYWPLKRLQLIQPDQKIKTAEGDMQKGKSKKKKKRHAAEEEVRTARPTDSKYPWALIGSLLWEKLPLFALTALSSIVTYNVQEAGGAVQPWSLLVRISNAVVSYITYIGQTIWPTGLAFFYPYVTSLPIWQVLGSFILLIAVTVTVIRMAEKIPYALVGWLWYVGTLVPVIGIVQVGTQARADRYTYLPLIGLFIIVAWGISELTRNWRFRKEALFASSIAVLACLSVVTMAQVRHWQNSFTLFDHTLNVTKDNWNIYSGRGTAYKNAGKYSEAIKDFNKVIEIRPEYAESYVHLWSIYSRTGDEAQATENLKTAARLGHEYAQDLLRKQGMEW